MAAAVLSLLLTTPSPAAEPRASLPDIEDEVMCPICGTSLELSESPQAERERELIRGLIAQGRTKEEIKDALVAEYGPDVLSLPERNGFDVTAWLIPAVGLLLGVLGLGLGLLRIRRRDQGDQAIEELSSEERQRLEADLSTLDS